MVTSPIAAPCFVIFITVCVEFTYWITRNLCKITWILLFLMLCVKLKYCDSNSWEKEELTYGWDIPGIDFFITEIVHPIVMVDNELTRCVPKPSLHSRFWNTTTPSYTSGHSASAILSGWPISHSWITALITWTSYLVKSITTWDISKVCNNDINLLMKHAYIPSLVFSFLSFV